MIDGTRWSARTVLALAFLWLACTGWLRALSLPDEGRYVGVAWEMVRSGEWMTPTLDGLPYFHKPPLFYWIDASVLSLVGNQAWAGRVAPWLGACLAAASCYLFGRLHGGERLARGWLLVLVTMPLVFMAAQYANLDMLVAGCISASILAFAHAALAGPADPGRRKALLLGYVATALGVLAKGLIGIVLPGLVLVVWLLLCRRPMQILRLLWWPGLLVFAVVAGPWFVVMQQRFPDFLHYFFVVQHFSRYTQQGFNNAQPFWFFPVVLALLGLPWTAWLLRRRPADAIAGAAVTRDVRLLMWVWLAAIVVFFSLPASKLVGYILPAAAPLAFLVADRWLAWRSAAPSGLLARGTGPVAAALCVVVAIAAVVVPQKSSRGLAAALAPHAGEPVAFLQNYFFDLPFYAHLRSPVPVIEHWDDPALTGGDNWRRELLDAAAFTAQPSPLLLPSVLQQANCPGARSWVVGQESLAQRYPLLATAPRVATSGGNALWEVRDWVPVPSDCAGTPNASSGRKS